MNFQFPTQQPLFREEEERRRGLQSISQTSPQHFSIWEEILIFFFFREKAVGAEEEDLFPPMMDRPDKWLRRTNFSSLQSRQEKAIDMPRTPITREKNEYFFSLSHLAPSPSSAVSL